MEISFSTLGCPDWNIEQVIGLAKRSGYDGIELRFVEGEDSLWRLPSFRGASLGQTRGKLADSGLAVCCLDTSCRFDSADAKQRQRWIEEGVRMAELAAELRAPGIRVFGDRIQTGQQRDVTRGWIAESLNVLQDKIAGTAVGVWLETHGDFGSCAEVKMLCAECPGIGLVWDPVAAFVESGERPLQSGTGLQAAIRHVHIKDVREANSQWSPVLIGEGEFPLPELKAALKHIEYGGFLSFEWETKWHPSIEEPEVAIPHFADWFRTEWPLIDHRQISSSPRTQACG